MTSEGRPESDGPRPAVPLPAKRRPDWSGYGQAVGVVAVCSGLAWLIFPYFALANLIMIYLLGTVVVATRLGRGPAILASISSVAAFDFFFVTPYLSFAVSDTQYLVTFAVMLVVALVISTLTVRIRRQADSARQRERRTAALYAMSRELASTRHVDEILHATARHVGEVFASEAAVYVPDAAGALTRHTDTAAEPDDDPHEQGVRRWVFEHGRVAGAGSVTLPGVRALYLPLIASRGTVGVLGVRPARLQAPPVSEQLHLLDAFAAQTALAIERALLAEEAQQAQLRVAAERIRSSLLSSVSHDLRTPLAGITGAASSLLESGDRLSPPARRELLEAIGEEAERLNRLVGNLLDMTRLEAGAIQVHQDWHSVEELIGAALARLAGLLGGRPVVTRVPPDLPLVPVDGLLIEQALINVLDNALKYTPAGSPIEIGAAADADAVTVTVADHGPGLPPGDEERVFEKFYRGRQAAKPGGVGLGLAICRGIMEAHQGRITAENRPGRGVVFRLTLPLGDKPPQVPPEDG